MDIVKTEGANRQIRQVTYLGIVANVFLAVVKAVVGLTAGSMALIADSIHSISDMVTDVALLLGVHFGSKEPDLKHPYGHGRSRQSRNNFRSIYCCGFSCHRRRSDSASERRNREVARHPTRLQ
jgi:hypothetical protein